MACYAYDVRGFGMYGMRRPIQTIEFTENELEKDLVRPKITKSYNFSNTKLLPSIYKT